MFKRKDKDNEDVYTPQREDDNKDRKKNVLIGVIIVVVLFIGWQVIKPEGVPGGTAVTKVDKTGQTPGISMHTPREEQAIADMLLEEHGPIPETEEGYGEGVQETVEASVDYVFYNLVRDDNPNIEGVNNETVLDRIAGEKDARWNGVFYDEYIAMELTQLYNLTLSETHTPEELSAKTEEGSAVANPREAYATTGEGIQVADITPDESPFYVVNVIVDYKSEKSLPVRIEYNVRMSSQAVIFDILPVGINVIVEEEE